MGAYGYTRVEIPRFAFLELRIDLAVGSKITRINALTTHKR
jgi:hypothetical protein